jgi:biopolymer transport protein ExbD
MKLTRRKTRAEVPSMAMGDIAFNLLIFFVILARASDDSHLQWTPAKVSNLKTAGNATVSVLIDKDSKLYLNGQQVGIAELANLIEVELGDAPQGKRTVLVKIHSDTLAQRFEPVIEAISEAGGDLVHIVEEEQE